jgi:hypothetical protein
MTAGYEDWDFWLGACERGFEFHHVQETLFYYRLKAESMLTAARKHHRSLHARIALNHPASFSAEERRGAAWLLAQQPLPPARPAVVQDLATRRDWAHRPAGAAGASPEPRRNLVVCAAGDRSVHRTWLGPPASRSYDVWLEHAGEDAAAFAGDPAEVTAGAPGPRWRRIAALLARRGEDLAQYDAVWLPADDLVVRPEALERAFQEVRARRLDVARAAATPGSAPVASEEDESLFCSRAALLPCVERLALGRGLPRAAEVVDAAAGFRTHAGSPFVTSPVVSALGGSPPPAVRRAPSARGEAPELSCVTAGDRDRPVRSGPTSALVTIALGDRHRALFDRHFRAALEAYARRIGVPLVVFERPLDDSPLAATRSVAWQKLLILEQPETRAFERVTWVDSDVLVTTSSENVMEAVPPGRWGGVAEEQAGTPRRETRQVTASRGLPDVALLLNTGVLVLERAAHAEALRQVYETDVARRARYEQADRGWFEEPFLSAALLAQGPGRLLPIRFNRLVNRARDQAGLRGAAAWADVYRSSVLLHWAGRAHDDRIAADMERIREAMDAAPLEADWTPRPSPRTAVAGS